VRDPLEPLRLALGPEAAGCTERGWAQGCKQRPAESQQEVGLSPPHGTASAAIPGATKSSR